MAEREDPMQKIPPEHQEIVNSTWSQLLNAEGGVRNLAVDLLKSFANQSGGGNADRQGQSSGGGDFLNQIGGLAGMLGARDQQSQNPSDNSQQDGNQRGGGNELLDQLSGLAGQFLNNRNRPEQPSQHQNDNNDQSGADQQQHSGGGSGGGGSANFLDQFGGLGNIAGMVSRGLGSQGGSSGGGNLIQTLGGLGGLAAVAGINLNDPSSLLKFFMKTAVADQAANPDNSSRDIYKTMKNVIFGLMGSKLPAEDFQENSEAKSAWKGYLGVIANALRKFSTQ